MNVIQKPISMNRSKQTLNPIGIVVHETATPGATAADEQAYFNSGNRNASAHAFIDWDNIVQCISIYEKAWHAGLTANSKFIGIELCRPAQHDTEKFQKVWNNAVEYFAYLFINYIKVTKITTDNLMSHDEVSRKWGETNHTDPVEYFKEYGKTVDDFRTSVQTEINSQLNSKFKAIELVMTDDAYAIIMTNPKTSKLFHKGDNITAIGSIEGYWCLSINNVEALIPAGPTKYK